MAHRDPGDEAAHDHGPAWLNALVPAHVEDCSDADVLAVTVAIAEGSVRARGGPFGAMIVDSDADVVSAGANQVVPTSDSTAHAEVVAIRAAQRRLGTHDLSSAPGAPFTLYTSCAPCIQCFGVIYWSGVTSVVAGARKELAEAVGFQEGPVSPELWAAARRDKSIHYALAELPEDLARPPFDAFRAAGGAVY